MPRKKKQQTGKIPCYGACGGAVTNHTLTEESRRDGATFQSATCVPCLKKRNEESKTEWLAEHTVTELSTGRTRQVKRTTL